MPQDSFQRILSIEGEKKKKKQAEKQQNKTIDFSPKGGVYNVLTTNDG